MVMVTIPDAARRLGVKPTTLYAYISRGVIRSHPSPHGRSRMLDADEVEALARRGRPRRSSRTAALDIVIETSLTSIERDVVRYRGHHQSDLAVSATFEEVAELLWSGTLPVSATWPAVPGSQPGSAPAGDLAEVGDRLSAIVTHCAASDPHRHDRLPDAITPIGRRLITAMVDGLPPVSDGPIPRLRLPGREPIRDSVAGRLWTRLSPARPPTGALAALNAALVLLADHELAASTLAVRVAASTRADPYATVSAGLSTVSGPLHGAASRHCRRLLRRAAASNSDVALDEAHHALGLYPGFGHRLYEGDDPRGVVLLALLRSAWPRHRAWVHIDASITAAHRRFGLAPNVDLALASLGELIGTGDDAGETVFAIARTAGWLAHAFEEYEEAPLRFRPRAVFRPSPTP